MPAAFRYNTVFFFFFLRPGINTLTGGHRPNRITGVRKFRRPRKAATIYYLRFRRRMYFTNLRRVCFRPGVVKFL